MDCDVAVVGAGAAGLAGAQHLRQAGLRVVVLEKSRGVGGRLATRRLHGTCVDHGCPALSVQGDRTRAAIARLQTEGILRPWYAAEGTTYYAAPAGISAVGKWFAAGLDVRKTCLVTGLNWDEKNCWSVRYASAEDGVLSARAVLLAVPSPQLVPLLAASPSVPETLVAAARTASYRPQIAVIAGYDASAVPDWPAIAPAHPVLAWIGRDSSKRTGADPAIATYLLHSTDGFARQHLDVPADALEPAARALLDAAGAIAPALAVPHWHQVRRWRYSVPERACEQPHLELAARLLACAGDWCGGNRVESALTSGTSAAAAIAQFLA